MLYVKKLDEGRSRKGWLPFLIFLVIFKQLVCYCPEIYWTIKPILCDDFVNIFFTGFT